MEQSKEPDPKDRAVEERKPERPKPPPGFRKFNKLLKQIIKAPPLRKLPSHK